MIGIYKTLEGQLLEIVFLVIHINKSWTKMRLTQKKPSKQKMYSNESLEGKMFICLLHPGGISF